MTETINFGLLIIPKEVVFCRLSVIPLKIFLKHVVPQAANNRMESTKLLLEGIAMKIAYVSSMLPRECGIATFTGSLISAMLKNKAGRAHEGIAIAVNDPDMDYKYNHHVRFIIRQEAKEDYFRAAEFINRSADICLLQHEFNIYGGEEGSYILYLVNRLEIPLVVNFHTVLKTPSVSQRFVLNEISNRAKIAIVMSETAARFCTTVYGIPRDKMEIIKHGIPDIQLNASEARRKLGLPERERIILSFGLLTENKGTEIVLKALPAVIHKHKNVLYIILGKTHPVHKRKSGEAYREFLENLTHDLNLDDYVNFKNEFVSNAKLNLYLAATDILITPYKDRDQISSGPLAFAMASRTAVVSTPFWNAIEMLAEGRGKLFGFNDSEKLAEILIDLLDNPEKMKAIKTRAYRFGRDITWNKIGPKYLALLQSVASRYKTTNRMPEHVKTGIRTNS